jgi:L-threonylcarbamoyladenylate synthase
VLAADRTVGLRVPDDPVARRVIEGVGGALAVTSANRSGAPPATTAAAVLEQLDALVDLILDGGPTRGGVASSVVRLDDGGALRLLRAGAISQVDLESALRPFPSDARP